MSREGGKEQERQKVSAAHLQCTRARRGDVIDYQLQHPRSATRGGSSMSAPATPRRVIVCEVLAGQLA